MSDIPVYAEQEMAVARRYKRITGAEPVGLIDTLRILFSEDMDPHLLNYIISIGYYHREVKL